MLPPFTTTNDPELVSQYIRAIFQDSKGNYWFGPIGGGAIRYDGTTLHYFDPADFTKGDPQTSSIHAIAEDKKGNMWFGTYTGVVKYDGKAFKTYNEKHGLTNPDISRRSILVDKKGTLWVGTPGGLYRYDPSSDKNDAPCFFLFKQIPSLKIKDIYEDRSGNIWIATSDKGIFRYNGTSVTNVEHGELLGDNYAGGIAQDKAGNMWFTMKNGICRFDGKSFIDITSKDGLGGTEFWGINIQNSGIIWITARGATTRYDPSLPLTDPKAFTVFKPEDGLNCCVQSMFHDRADNLWLGTGQGLYRFEGKKFYQVKKSGPW